MRSGWGTICCNGWHEEAGHANARQATYAYRKTPGGRLFRVNVSATASRSEVGLVYVAAVMQGLALVTFPAASSDMEVAVGLAVYR